MTHRKESYKMDAKIKDRHCCSDMEMLIDDDAVIYNEVFDEYGFQLCEDMVSVIIFEYCPWCGKKLPKSMRDEWFDQLEALGYENPLFCEDIPKEFKSRQWREHGCSDVPTDKS